MTRFVDRGEISYVEAQGDYARLHTASGDAYLVRIPLSTLEEEWRSAGFQRIHRSLLVALAHVDEVRTEAGRCTVLVGEAELPVARRHTRELRDVLVRRARGTARERAAGRSGSGSPGRRAYSGGPRSRLGDVHEQTPLGDIYLRSLLGAARPRRPGAGAGRLALGGLPLAVPALARAGRGELVGLPLAWLLLGGLVYPLLLVGGLALCAARRAQRARLRRPGRGTPE